MRQTMIVAFLICAFCSYAGVYYNVRDYGAKGDGKTLDSPAINAAIEAAVADGGGQVFLPAGIYLSGSIRLKSNIDLHLSPGCTLLAAPDEMNAYDESESFGGFPEYQDVKYYRPDAVLDDVKDATIREIYAPTEPGIDKIVLFNCKDIVIKE